MSSWLEQFAMQPNRTPVAANPSATRAKKKRTYCRRVNTRQETQAKLLSLVTEFEWRKTADIAKAAKLHVTTTQANLASLEGIGKVVSKKLGYSKYWRIAA